MKYNQLCFTALYDYFLRIPRKFERLIVTSTPLFLIFVRDSCDEYTKLLYPYNRWTCATHLSYSVHWEKEMNTATNWLVTFKKLRRQRSNIKLIQKQSSIPRTTDNSAWNRNEGLKSARSQQLSRAKNERKNIWKSILKISVYNSITFFHSGDVLNGVS